MRYHVGRGEVKSVLLWVAFEQMVALKGGVGDAR